MQSPSLSEGTSRERRHPKVLVTIARPSHDLVAPVHPFAMPGGRPEGDCGYVRGGLAWTCVVGPDACRSPSGRAADGPDLHSAGGCGPRSATESVRLEPRPTTRATLGLCYRRAPAWGYSSA